MAGHDIEIAGAVYLDVPAVRLQTDQGEEALYLSADDYRTAAAQDVIDAGKAGVNHTHPYLPTAGGTVEGAVNFESTRTPDQTTTITNQHVWRQDELTSQAEGGVTCKGILKVADAGGGNPTQYRPLLTLSHETSGGAAKTTNIYSDRAAFGGDVAVSGSISEGGTALKDKYFRFLGRNPITSAAQDTREVWLSLGNGFAYFDSFVLNGQPYQWCWVTNLTYADGVASEVFQTLWQHMGPNHYLRMANPSVPVMQGWVQF